MEHKPMRGLVARRAAQNGRRTSDVQDALPFLPIASWTPPTISERTSDNGRAVAGWSKRASPLVSAALRVARVIVPQGPGVLHAQVRGKL